MSTSTFIAFLAIVFIGIPAGLRLTGSKVRIRNPVALAMVVMWFAGQAMCAAAGGNPSLQDMIKVMTFSDAAVIASMFFKEDWATCPYTDWWRQFTCLWYERTPWDKVILVLFPVAWLFYTPLVGGDFQYWTLWGIGLLQLALAGHEAFYSTLRAVGQKLRANDERPTGLEFAAWSGKHV